MQKRLPRYLSFMLSVLVCAALGFFALPATAEDVPADGPYIRLGSVPAYGEDMAVVELELVNGDGSPAAFLAYEATLFLQVEEGGAYWVKPLFDEPTVTADEDGVFRINCTTGGIDQLALTYHIFALPQNTPVDTYENALAACVDYVRVDRQRDGGNTVFRPGALPKGPYDAGIPVEEDRIGLDVGLYRGGISPLANDSLRPTLIFDTLSPLVYATHTVRFYSAAGDVLTAYDIAGSYDLNAVGTAWLGGDEEADQKELDGLIALANKGMIRLAVVGSETLYRGDLAPEKLLSSMEYVKRRLYDPMLPVSTAETLDVLAANPNVLDACDVICLNIYPYWEGLSVDKAQARLDEAAAALARLAPGKQLVITETGWPTAGEDGPKADEADAVAYFELAQAWSVQNNIPVLFFSACDESWKSQTSGVEAHFGIWDEFLILKNGYAGCQFFARMW